MPQCLNVSRSHCPNASTSQRLNASTPQRLNASTSQQRNISMSQRLNVSTSQRLNASMFKCKCLYDSIQKFPNYSNFQLTNDSKVGNYKLQHFDTLTLRYHKSIIWTLHASAFHCLFFNTLVHQGLFTIPDCLHSHQPLPKDYHPPFQAACRWCLLSVQLLVGWSWNNCTPKGCLHIGAFPNKCTIKHPFHTMATWKVWKFMKTTSLCSVWKKTNFLIRLY